MKLKELINSMCGKGWEVELRGLDDRFIAQEECDSTKLMPYYDCEIKGWYPGAGSQYSNVSMTVYLANSKAREELLTAMKSIKNIVMPIRMLVTTARLTVNAKDISGPQDIVRTTGLRGRKNDK